MMQYSGVCASRIAMPDVDKNGLNQRRLPPKVVIHPPPEIATSTKVTNCIELSKYPITHDNISGK